MKALALALVLILTIGLVPAPAKDAAAAPTLLDEALERAGLRRSDLFIPADLVEVDPFRRDVVSRLMEHPLEMPGYVRSLAAAMRGQESLLGMFQMALAQERLSLGKPDREFAIEGTVRYPVVSLEEVVQQLTKAARAALGDDLAAISALREDGSLGRDALSLYASDDEGDGAGGDVIWMTDVRRFLDRAAAVDRAAIARLGEVVLGHAELLAAVLAAIPADLAQVEATRTVVIDDLVVRIGGVGNDVHEGEIDVVIDLGGDDTYRDVRSRGPIAVIVDVAGDDVHMSSSSRETGPASAVLGCSVLIDLSGDDVYRAGDRSLGCGILGLGVLDDRAGNDTYVAGQVGQGAGVLGWGILADRAGHDTYVGRGYVQAFAGVDGFGMLLDLSGNDTYVAGGQDPDPREAGVTQSMSQGFGFGLRPFASGGIALLHDAAGNDAYEGDYFAQGSSYWFALGAIVDGAGNDRYAARRYSGGAGIHLSVGVVVDESGNDAYAMGTGVGLGCGHDYAHGILLDAGGDDSYQAAWLCLGAGNANGVGILCDVAGRDAYSISRRSLGWGTWDAKRGAGSIGVLVDGGGPDTYPAPGRDGTAWLDGRWGVGFDGKGGDPFPAVDLAAWLKRRAGRPATPKDFFARGIPAFAAAPTNVGGSETDTSARIAHRALSVLGRFEAGLEERKKEARRWLEGVARQSPEDLVPYLRSPNVLVTIETDRALRAVGKTAVGALATAAAGSDPALAAAALRVLAGIPDPSVALPLGRVVTRGIRSEDRSLRRTAGGAVAKLSSWVPSLRPAVLDLLASADLREAAAGSRAVRGMPGGREVLIVMLGHPHHLVRAAASQGLAAAGEAARDALLATLRSGPAVAATEAARLLESIPGEAVDEALLEALERRDDRGVVAAAIGAVTARDGLAVRAETRLAVAREWALGRTE